MGRAHPPLHGVSTESQCLQWSLTGSRCLGLSIYTTTLPFFVTSFPEFPQCFHLAFDYSKYTGIAQCWGRPCPGNQIQRLPPGTVQKSWPAVSLPSSSWGPPACSRVLQLSIPASALKLVSGFPLAGWEPWRKGHRWVGGLLLAWSVLSANLGLPHPRSLVGSPVIRAKHVDLVSRGFSRVLKTPCFLKVPRLVSCYAFLSAGIPSIALQTRPMP